MTLLFDQIFIEDEIRDHPQTQKILAKIFPAGSDQRDLVYIDRYDQYFGRVKKPYLHKRTNFNLYIARKKGSLIKEAPLAYGLDRLPHYYFIHAYNCLYECHYCYLQGHFKSPDMVFFINHEEIVQEMQLTLERHQASSPTDAVWFHAGEFSDSLALSHITQELPYYFDFFHKNPLAFLELRSKAANVKELLALAPSPNIIASFSLSSAAQCALYDQKAPPLKARFQAIKKLYQHGYQIALHLDPLIWSPSFEVEMTEFVSELACAFPLTQVSYISLGVVRFPKDVKNAVEKNYPQTPFLQHDFVAAQVEGHEGKYRYPLPLRMGMLECLRKLLLAQAVPYEKIYFCMEEDQPSPHNN